MMSRGGSILVSAEVHEKKSPVKDYFARGPAGKQAAEIRAAEINLARKKKHRIVRATGIYLCDVAQLYLDHLRAQGKTERFRHELSNLLNNSFLPLLSDRPVEHLDFTDIMRVAEKYADKAQATRNRYFDYLRAIFRFGVDQEITTNNPMKKWKKIKEARRTVYLTADDLRRIYEHAAPHLQWAIEIEWHLGTRPGESELLTIKWTDVDFQNNTIHVRGTKTATSDRLVNFNADFRARLLEMRERALTDYLVEYEGKQMKKFRYSFKAACGICQ